MSAGHSKGPGLPPQFPPPWASGWGEDRHGVFAEILLADEVALELRWIPAGSFLMGSPETEVGRWKDEGPQHEVTLSRGYWLGATPVTQAQWVAVMGKNPSRFQADGEKRVDWRTRPVERVSWDACGEFCVAVAARVPGLGARLPSEAEWEYACRAGTTGAFNDGSACTVPEGKDPALEKLGWHGEGEKGETHAVGLKKPNAWGLRDMHGNVWEWCHDWWRGGYDADAQVDPTGPEKGVGRVVRGGGCFSRARYCRSACRGGFAPDFRDDFLGFRLAAGQELKNQ